MIRNDPGFWVGKRVFVTGHTGFKGAWLAATLHRLGARVDAFALPPATEPSLFHAARIDRRVRHVEGDVRDAAALLTAVRAAQPEIVFHLAGQALVSRAHDEPAATFATNVMGTVNVLDAIRVTGSVRSAVLVTSDKCYRNIGQSCGEGDRLGGLEAYGASKAAAELAIEAFREAFMPAGGPVGIASARAGNVFGGGDLSANRLIPDLMRACSRGEAPALRYPHAVRPWQHVLDAVRGYLLLAEGLFSDSAGHAGPWNFGPIAGSEWSVERIAVHVAELWGIRGWRPAAALAAHEDPILRLRTDKARERLNWTTLLAMPAALTWSVEAYRALLGSGDAAWLDAQIDRYLALAADPKRELLDAAA